MKTNYELTLDAAREALFCIPPDDRYIWVKMAMALKDEYGDDARDMWFDWSSGSKDYKEQDATSVWKSCEASGKVTIASLIYEAKQFGWQPKRGDKVKVTPEKYARKQAERERRRAANEEETRAKAKRAAKRAAELWAAAEPATGHPYLARKGIQPHGARILPVWERKVKDEATGEITTVSVLDPLIIPVFIGPKTISTVQAIFPAVDPVLGRDKDYLPGGAKQGGYYPIGAITKATLRVIICEGFATGASIYEATGCPVIVTFDAGNLITFAESIRAKLPDVEIIIAGDNDLWTKNNPGATKANAAAWAVHGRLALPTFEDLEGEPTDFNDLADLARIREQINAAVEPQDPEHYKPECLWKPAPAPAAAPDPATTEQPQPEVGADESPQNTGSPSQPAGSSGGDVAVQETPPADAPTDAGGEHEIDDDAIDTEGTFSILGYDHEKYFVFQHERKQLTIYTPGSFTDTGFIALAPLQFWEMNFPAESGFNKRAALNWFIRTAHRRGIFDPSRTRGRGAWVDRGRVVLHLGNVLIVDGVEVPITDIKSRYVYELDRSLPALAPAALTSEEGEEILATAMMFRWNKPASAPMLAGWCALAPLCGALRWRPHIWVTGGPGTGKSWILNNFIHPLMNSMSVFAQGNSTEAGIRQTLRCDALPVLFDESEKNNEREKNRVDGVLALVRQASTESAAKTLKGSAFGDAMQFHIRSMFCLASIQVGLEKQADYERMAVLSLRPKREDDGGSADRWKSLQDRVYTLLKRDEDLPSRLFRRAIDLLPTTLQNIEVFATAAAEKFGSQRDGDQYGTLIAGAWSLISDRVATPAEAREMLDYYEWTEFMEYTEADESSRALNAVLSAPVRVQGSVEVSVHEIVQRASGREVSGVDLSEETADVLLQRHGMRVKDGYLLFSNAGADSTRALLKGTAFESDLRGHILRLPGATRYGNVAVKIGASISKVVAMPLDKIIVDEPKTVHPMTSAVPMAATEDRPF